jgi:hypothetical protein
MKKLMRFIFLPSVVIVLKLFAALPATIMQFGERLLPKLRDERGKIGVLNPQPHVHQLSR